MLWPWEAGCQAGDWGRAVLVTLSKTASPFGLPSGSERVVISADVGRCTRIVTQVLQALGKEAEAGIEQPAWHLAQQLAGLVALSCREHLSRDSLDRRRDLLFLPQSFTERKVGNPELSQSLIARDLNISTRKLHRALKNDGLTVSGWTRPRRLEQCRTIGRSERRPRISIVCNSAYRRGGLELIQSAQSTAIRSRHITMPGCGQESEQTQARSDSTKFGPESGRRAAEHVEARIAK